MTSQIQSPQEDPDDLVGGFVETLNNHDNSYNKYLTFVSKAHVSPAYARGGIMAPMITSKTAYALKFPVKSPQKEKQPKLESNEKNDPPKPSKKAGQHDVDLNIKSFTEKDFDIEFSKWTAKEQCILKIPLIDVLSFFMENISMEYHWNMKGRYILYAFKNRPLPSVNLFHI